MANARPIHCYYLYPILMSRARTCPARSPTPRTGSAAAASARASRPSSACSAPAPIASPRPTPATPPPVRAAPCQQRYHCRVEKNATQMAVRSWRLARRGNVPEVLRHPPRKRQLLHRAHGVLAVADGEPEGLLVDFYRMCRNCSRQRSVSVVSSAVDSLHR